MRPPRGGRTPDIFSIVRVTAEVGWAPCSDEEYRDPDNAGGFHIFPLMG